MAGLINGGFNCWVIAAFQAIANTPALNTRFLRCLPDACLSAETISSVSLNHVYDATGTVILNENRVMLQLIPKTIPPQHFQQTATTTTTTIIKPNSTVQSVHKMVLRISTPTSMTGDWYEHSSIIVNGKRTNCPVKRINVICTKQVDQQQLQQLEHEDNGVIDDKLNINHLTGIWRVNWVDVHNDVMSFELNIKVHGPPFLTIWKKYLKIYNQIVNSTTPTIPIPIQIIDPQQLRLSLCPLPGHSTLDSDIYTQQDPSYVFESLMPMFQNQLIPTLSIKRLHRDSTTYPDVDLHTRDNNFVIVNVSPKGKPLYTVRQKLEREWQIMLDLPFHPFAENVHPVFSTPDDDDDNNNNNNNNNDDDGDDENDNINNNNNIQLPRKQQSQSSLLSHFKFDSNYSFPSSVPSKKQKLWKQTILTAPIVKFEELVDRCYANVQYDKSNWLEAKYVDEKGMLRKYFIKGVSHRWISTSCPYVVVFKFQRFMADPTAAFGLERAQGKKTHARVSHLEHYIDLGSMLWHIPESDSESDNESESKNDSFLQVIYELKSFIVHIGHGNGGHYVTYISKSTEENGITSVEWRICDDNQVRVVTEQEVEQAKEMVYIAFYERLK